MIAFQSNRLCEKNSIAKIGDIQLAKVELMEMHLAGLNELSHTWYSVATNICSFTPSLHTNMLPAKVLSMTYVQLVGFKSTCY